MAILFVIYGYGHVPLKALHAVMFIANMNLLLSVIVWVIRMMIGK